MGQLSTHFKGRQPSGIRIAQIEYAKRTDKDLVKDINLAIGNVSLPMHPAMSKRMRELGAQGSPFEHNVVKYSSTPGFLETQQAVLNIIQSSGFSTEGLYAQITDGGSHAMELVTIGVAGKAGEDADPMLLIDAAYTNYQSFAQRTGRKIVTIRRELEDHGKFTLPELEEIAKTIETEKPKSMVVIPYDNPTGHFYDHKTLVDLAKLCVENDMWMISDEAYRELHYVDHDPVSIWGLTDKEVPGIQGRRISIETASKVWNACGLRIGAMVTDNEDFYNASVAENTANLCPNVIGQYIFGALAHESHQDLQVWYGKQREYYKGMMFKFTKELKEEMPGAIISSPDASLYTVVDVRNIVGKDFNAMDFVLWCSRDGKATVGDVTATVLTAPMAGFYQVAPGEDNPGRTQMRVAFVETPKVMDSVPKLYAKLFEEYVSLKE